MPLIKLPSSMTEKEALKSIYAQGYNTVLSLNRMKDGSILIDVK